MGRTLLVWGRLLAPAGVLGILVWRLGTGPFLEGLRSVGAGPLAGAVGLTALTTVGYAWRWKIVAGGLGVDLPLPTAVLAYYRALFLNATLPGGILGDVHRGVSHGRDVQDFGRALRSVAWERLAGQVVQVLMTVVVLLVLPSPVQTYMPWVALALALGTGAVGVLLLAPRRSGPARSRWSRIRRAAAGDVRDGLLARRAWPGIVLASALGLGGHAATFLLAARAVGTTTPPSRMLPIALLVIAAMTLPSVAGWGPREGVAAWAFGAAGLGAGQGVATAVVYGVMVLVASLPGAAVLLVGWFRHRHRQPARPPLRGRPARA
jgi:glycosyltransferase 2 family protein